MQLVQIRKHRKTAIANLENQFSTVKPTNTFMIFLKVLQCVIVAH